MRTSALSVAEYMTRAPCTASPKELLASARRLMDEHAIRHLAVESGGKLVGILSDRDLQLVRTLAHAPPDVLTVEDVMTPDPYTVRPNAPLDDVVRVMAERKIGSAVVLERGRIVGVFTSTDAMNALSDVLRERRGAGPEHGSLARMRSSVAKTARLPNNSVVDDALAAVMGALAERLTAGEAHQLLDALPGELQPVFEPCVLNREGKPTRKLERAEFVDRVAEELCLTPVHGELVCQAVFVSLRRELPEKLARDVAHQLPHGLAQLWLGAPPVEPTAEHTLSAYAARQAIAGEIDSAGPLPTGVTSEDAFSAVMCAFSERLSRGQAREVFLGLPEPLRPPVERCMLHRAEPGVAFGREELLRRIGDHLHLDAPRAEAIAHAVLAGLKRVLPEKAALDTENQLPADLLELWKRC